MALGNLDPERLEQIKESLTDLETLALYDVSDYAHALRETGRIALELVEEVERSHKCLQDVADLIADNAPFGEDVRPHDIMVALRGAPYGAEV